MFHQTGLKCLIGKKTEIIVYSGSPMQYRAFTTQPTPSSIQTKRIVKLLTHRNSDFFFNYLGSSKEKPYVVGIESCRRTLLFWVWISLIFYSFWNAPICKLISAAVIFCSECLRYAQNQKKQQEVSIIAFSVIFLRQGCTKFFQWMQFFILRWLTSQGEKCTKTNRKLQSQSANNVNSRI